jgi:hypothetical protein
MVHLDGYVRSTDVCWMELYNVTEMFRFSSGVHVATHVNVALFLFVLPNAEPMMRIDACVVPHVSLAQFSYDPLYQSL